MEFIDHSTETMELAKALLEVQRQMSPAAKDAKNPFIGNNYATLNSVMESCREALLSNNIWLCQYPVPVDTPESIGLMTKLTHAESGQWQASLAVVPLPKFDPQGMGSAITYARRYAITAMLGMVTEDDDGEAAKSPARNSRAGAKNAPRQSTSKTKGNSAEITVQNQDLQEYESNPETPQLEGVIFQHVTAHNGRDCIIATGNTQPNRLILSKAGFRWNADRKVWWKYSYAI